MSKNVYNADITRFIRLRRIFSCCNFLKLISGVPYLRSNFIGFLRRASSLVILLGGQNTHLTRLFLRFTQSSVFTEFAIYRLSTSPKTDANLAIFQKNVNLCNKTQHFDAFRYMLFLYVFLVSNYA